MISAVRNAVAELGLELADAVAMAAMAPAAFLGDDDRGLLAPGRRADLVWVDCDLAVRGTWINGVAVEPVPKAIPSTGGLSETRRS